MTTTIDSLPENWEAELEYQLLLDQRDKYSKRAYICSPCSDSSKKLLYRNIRAARLYMYYAKKDLCLSSRAPHTTLPLLLSDMVPAERAMALKIGRDILEICDLVLVCGNKLTSGMRSEIEYAALLSIPIQVFHHDLFIEIRKIVTRTGVDKRLVRYEPDQSVLATNAEELFEFTEEKAYA